MKVALIVCRAFENKYSEQYFGTPINLTSILVELGFSPVFVGFNSGNPEEILANIMPTICVLTGGESIGEQPSRDQFETELLSSCDKLNIPVIGICRGMQIMANYFGVTTVPIHSHAGTRHIVTGKLTFEVNSFHHNALLNAPIGFAVDYRSPDGSVEAFSNLAKNWFGVMWHPEREPFESPGYDYFANIARYL